MRLMRTCYMTLEHKKMRAKVMLGLLLYDEYVYYCALYPANRQILPKTKVVGNNVAG